MLLLSDVLYELLLDFRVHFLRLGSVLDVPLLVAEAGLGLRRDIVQASALKEIDRPFQEEKEHVPEEVQGHHEENEPPSHHVPQL